MLNAVPTIDNGTLLLLILITDVRLFNRISAILSLHFNSHIIIILLRNKKKKKRETVFLSLKIRNMTYIKLRA